MDLFFVHDQRENHMRFYLRHHFGPYVGDYYVFIEDCGACSHRIRHVAPASVTYRMLEDADAAFKLPDGAFASVDVLEDRSGAEPRLVFDFEVHRSRGLTDAEDRARAASDATAAHPHDVPLSELQIKGPGDTTLGSGGPIPLSCSKNCATGPDTIPCTEGTRAACNPNTHRLECVDDEG